MDISPERIHLFQERILTWYTSNKRDLPWRHTRDPYKILVSEIMSQQTQISRVIPKYNSWLKKFPGVQDLAQAKRQDVLEYWSGLGYNRRALYLKKTAEIIASELQGNFPKSVDELRTLPGLGRYTASAVACFAFDAQIPVIDTNIRKVIAHEFFSGALPDEKTIENIALLCLPKDKAHIWNQALMDYSSLILKKEKIPVPKQSPFLSSNRYYRGQILKLLVKKRQLSVSALSDFFSKDNPLSRSRLEQILRAMEKDDLIEYEHGMLFLDRD